MTLVLTACTNKKRSSPESSLRAASLPSGPLAFVADAWAERVRAAPRVTPARRMYCGSSWTEAVFAADAVKARLGVVSAGLGYLEAETATPSYGLTVARGEADSIYPKVDERLTSAQWWTEISDKRLMDADLAEALAAEDGLVLAALPDAYLAMVAETLTASRAAYDGRLRIFTGGTAPTALSDAVLPYDARLDGAASTWRGTQSNYAARALRHFVEKVLVASPDGDLLTHHAAVRDGLRGFEAPATIKRQGKTDAELKALLEIHWEAGGGVASRLLRILRDDLLVACEQGRAGRLVREIAQQKAVK